MNVLVIEDDKEIVETIKLGFQLRWPNATVISTGTGNEGVERVENESPDIVILDIGLPDVDGFEVLQQIRRFSDVPLIVLTGKAMEELDKVKGLELGADDYLIKPFSHTELLSRVRALLRRTKMPELRGKEGALAGGHLVIDLSARQVTVNGNPVALTPTEWNLLSHLVRNEGRVVSQEMLAEKLWESDESAYTSAIRTAIHRLRAKLGDDPQDPRIIITERGLGYRFLRPK